MQSPDYIADDFCQPQFSHPPIQVEEDRGAPLLNCAGLAIIRFSVGCRSLRTQAGSCGMRFARCATSMPARLQAQ